MIDPALFAQHDDETLAGMHGIEVAEVAELRAKASTPAQAAPSGPVSAPSPTPAADTAQPSRRAQKAKPAAEPEAASPGHVFAISVPYDAHTTLPDLMLAVERALKAAAADLPPHLRPDDAPAAAPEPRRRAKGSAVKFVGPKSIRVQLPGTRSAAVVNYGDVFIGEDADHLSEHHRKDVEPHPRPRR